MSNIFYMMRGEWKKMGRWMRCAFPPKTRIQNSFHHTHFETNDYKVIWNWLALTIYEIHLTGWFVLQSLCRIWFCKIIVHLFKVATNSKGPHCHVGPPPKSRNLHWISHHDYIDDRVPASIVACTPNRNTISKNLYSVLIVYPPSENFYTLSPVALPESLKSSPE